MKDTQWNKMTLIHGENIKKEKKEMIFQDLIIIFIFYYL